MRSQFLPHVEVDQATGDVIVAWYDPRNDDGCLPGGVGGTDGTCNNEYQLYVGLSRQGGEAGTFQNAPLSGRFEDSLGDCVPAFSEADVNATPTDYLGVGIRDEVIYAAYADNSNSLLDNPDVDCGPGEPPCMDIYVPEPCRGWQMLAGVLALAAVARRRR